MHSRLIKLFLIIPILIIIVFLIYSYHPEESFTARDKYNLIVVGDGVEGGTTTVSGGLLKTGSYELTYTLGDVYDYPYANMYIDRIDTKLIDFTKHDYIKVNLKSSSSDFLMFRVYIFIDNHTIIGDHPTYLPLIYRIPVTQNFTDCIIPIDKLRIPHWWYLDSSLISRPKELNYSLDSVIYFEISNDDDKETGISDTIIVESITMHKDIRRVLLSILKILGIYTLLIIILYTAGKLKKSIKRTITYSSLNLNQDDFTDDRIEKYIGSNYSDPLLSLTKISDDLDIPVKAISDHIHNRFKLSFPLYLNNIRISEAKVILRTTKIKILDIAISVGYNSAGHFNRTFKQMEKCTPGDYRRTNMQF